MASIRISSRGCSGIRSLNVTDEPEGAWVTAGVCPCGANTSFNNESIDPHPLHQRLCHRPKVSPANLIYGTPLNVGSLK